MAALIKERLHVESNLVEGDRGEFTVWVADEMVARKTPLGFPTEDEAVAAVDRALTRE